MDEDNVPVRKKFLCFDLWEPRKWLWTYTIVPSGLRFALHLTAVVVDLVVACRLLWSHQLIVAGVVTLSMVYNPVLLTLWLAPPQPPQGPRLTDLLAWATSLTVNIIVSPVLISMSLFKHFTWTIWAIRMKKPCKEVLAEYDECLPREIHSYLFLQAFTECAPQTVLQLHLLLLGVTNSHLTAGLQAVSVAVSLIKLAWCVTDYHRYEAQVVGGRTPVLLLSPPQHKVSEEILPVSYCLLDKVTPLEQDSPSGKVVLFISWLLLTSGRILCVVVSLEVHLSVTVIVLSTHFSVILLYFLSSQSTSLLDVPYRLMSAFFSLISLIEVSVHFHKTPLLYSLFFILLSVENTFLMVLFFVYPSDKCASVLSCSHFGMFAYFTINSNVIGVIMFGIYLSCLRPSPSLVTADSSTSGSRSS